MATYYITLLFVVIFSAQANRVCVYRNGYPLGRSNNRQYFFFVGLTAFVLIVVAGLRYHVGTDYNNYVYGFDYDVVTVWQRIISFNEPGFPIVEWLSDKLHGGYVLAIFIASLITIVLFVNPISKYSNDFFFSILLFVFIGAWAGSFNGIRQYIAASIIICGHRYIFDRKIWKYLLVVFVATVFHRTALIMIIPYFIAKDNMKVQTELIIFAVGIVLFFSGDFLLELMSFLKGSDQTEYAYMNTSVNLMRLLVSVAPILFISLLSTNYKNEPENAFYFNMLVINAAFLIGTSYSAYLARVAIYTETFIAFALPRIVGGIKENQRRIVKFFILALYFIYWLYEISSRETLNNFQWIIGR